MKNIPKHQHDFSYKGTVKVRLHDQRQDIPIEQRGIIAGIDTIMVHKCKCGATEAYDLERMIV